jgi:hypothetical protein
MLLPYLWGLLTAPKGIPVASFAGHGGIADLLTLLINNPTLLVYRPNTPPLYIPLTDVQSIVFQIVGIFSILASVYIFVHGILKRSFANVVIGIAFLAPPTLALILPRSYDHYFVPLLPATAIVQAIALIGITRRHTLLTLSGIVLIGGLCTVQMDYFNNFLHIFDTFSTFNFDWQPSLQTTIQFYHAAQRENIPTLIYIGGTAGDRPNLEYSKMWRMLTASQPLDRVISISTSTFIIPADGATIIQYGTDSSASVALPSELKLSSRSALSNWLSVSDMAPVNLNPVCKTQADLRLSNGVQFNGYYAANTRTQRLAWKVDILWQPTSINAQLAPQYQIFAHLTNENNHLVAQYDGAVLPTTLWRLGDTMLTQVTLPSVSDTSHHFALHIGMYTLPYSGALSVEDVSGKPVGNEVIIPLCE